MGGGGGGGRGQIFFADYKTKHFAFGRRYRSTKSTYFM